MMPLKDYNSFVSKKIDVRLGNFFDKKISDAKKIDSIYAKLLEDMKKFILRGGKRLRPTLMLMGYQAAGGKDEELALDAAVALEIFHNFVLIHDDVMDGDLKRYGGANITGIYDKRFSKYINSKSARHSAESIAILAGELNEFFTFEILTELNIKPEITFALMRHFQKTLFETGAGQQLDVMSNIRPNLNLSKIEKVNYYKTAQYTITSPLNMGVLLAEGDEALINSFGEFGAELGKAFQLADDLIGMFGSSKQTGKPVGSDIREGKQTVLIYFAKKLCDDKQWKSIESRFGRDNIVPSDVKLVRSILKDCGAQAKVTVAADDHLQKSLKVLEGIDINKDLKKLFEEFANYCVVRKK